MTDLKSKFRDFADKIGGVTRVDNKANPGSALNMMKRKMASNSKSSPKPIQPSALLKQKTLGVPGAD